MKYVLSILILLFLNIGAVLAQEEYSDEDDLPKAVLQSIILNLAENLSGECASGKNVPCDNLADLIRHCASKNSHFCKSLNTHQRVVFESKRKMIETMISGSDTNFSDDEIDLVGWQYADVLNAYEACIDISDQQECSGLVKTVLDEISKNH